MLRTSIGFFWVCVFLKPQSSDQNRKKKRQTHKVPEEQRRGLSSYNREISTGRIYYTMLPPARTKPSLQWFHGFLSWAGKFALYLPLLLSQSECFLRLATL